MKIGFRVPSIKKRISARTSWKRVVRHSMGIKAPKGFGAVTNPKRALYNRVYNKQRLVSNPPLTYQKAELQKEVVQKVVYSYSYFLFFGHFMSFTSSIESVQKRGT